MEAKVRIQGQTHIGSVPYLGVASSPSLGAEPDGDHLPP